MLHQVNPREQVGRDTFSRYRTQVRSAAMASLSILEGGDIDRVYCDFHDDFVVRKRAENSYSYLFYQVKTKRKQNHNWTLAEVFGLKSTLKNQSKQVTEKIKNSFVGKLLLHTVVFDKYCNSIIFQTNINNSDDVDKLLIDISSGKFCNKFTKVLIEKFNACFDDQADLGFTEDEIKEKLSKLTFETDVAHLKDNEDHFQAIASGAIYRFSEVELGFIESREIILKLLELVANKSSGVIQEITAESIEAYASVSIDDLLPILSISKDAYRVLLDGGDSQALKSVSIIQRSLLSSGAGIDEIEYVSRCKTDWDVWQRINRHVLFELDQRTITEKIRTALMLLSDGGASIKLETLRPLIKGLLKELDNDGLLYDLNENLILGGFFSEIVKGKS